MVFSPCPARLFVGLHFPAILRAIRVLESGTVFFCSSTVYSERIRMEPAAGQSSNCHSEWRKINLFTSTVQKIDGSAGPHDYAYMAIAKASYPSSTLPLGFPGSSAISNAFYFVSL